MKSYNTVAQLVPSTNAELTLVSAWLRQRDEQMQLLPARIPLGLLYLQATAQNAGFTVDIRDLQLLDEGDCGVDTPTLIEQALEGAAPIIGISCMSDLLPAVVIAIERYKRHNPSSIIILGGPGPSAIGMELLRSFPWLDIVIYGEGEQTLIELLNALRTKQSLNEIPGLCRRVNEYVINTGHRARLHNLDQLLPLSYDIFPRDRYQSSVPVITSRGCPYPCSFCAVAKLWGNQTTRHSIPVMLQMLKDLGDRGYQQVAFVDDTFILHRKRVLEMCQGMQQFATPIEWHCNGRINLIDKELIKTMYSAGCRSIFFGLESGSNKLLQQMRKGFSVEETIRIVTMSASYLQITVSFIWGFPDESWSDFLQTYTLCEKLLKIPNVSIQVHLLTPYPGVPIYEQHAEEIAFEPNIHSHIRSSKNLSVEEETIIRSNRSLFPSFYYFPTPQLHDKLAYISQLERKIR